MPSIRRLQERMAEAIALEFRERRYQKMRELAWRNIQRNLRDQSMTTFHKEAQGKPRPAPCVEACIVSPPVAAKPSRPFPKVMCTDSGIVVLMQSYEDSSTGHGTYLGYIGPGDPPRYEIGTFTRSWYLRDFKDSEVAVTLQNSKED